MAKTWPEERIQMLISMRRDGISCGRIAETLKVSRNAVIGKASRLGVLVPRMGPDPRGGPRPPKAKKRPLRFNYRFERTPEELKSPGIIPVEVLPPGDMPAARATGHDALMRLQSRDCRWPIGDPGADDFRFCGAPRMPGAAYCQHHYSKSTNNNGAA